MAITIDGTNKQIVVDTSTSFAWLDIYNVAVSWAALSANLKYLLPMTSTGKAAMGGGVFTDLVFTLVNGWKIKPSGYAANSQVTITGTAVTSDGSAIAVAPTAGSPVQWYFQAATAGTISVVGGSALTSEEHNKLMAVPASTDNAMAVWAKTIEVLTAEEMMRVMLAGMAGKRSGLGTGTEQNFGRDGVTPRITLTPTDANGNGTPIINGAL